MRILRMVGSENAVVVHSEAVCPELEMFFKDRRVSTQPYGSGNSFRFCLQGLTKAFSLLRKLPRATFIIWAHHSDSNRWLQLALALSGRRYVLVERSIPSDSSTFKNSRLSVPIKRIVASRAFRVVVNAKLQVEHYRQLFRVRSARVTHISNSRSVASISERVTKLRKDRAGLRSALALPLGRLLLCVGSLSSYKGQTELIHALWMISRANEHCPTLVLVGDGPDRLALENLAQDLVPSCVIFAGYQADPIPWLAAADVFVLPSMLEGLPGALIEAMASELPCVVSDIPGTRDLIRNEQTGLLVPPNDKLALASAIKRMLSDADLASRCARSGCELVAREFDESTEREAWLSLIGELTGNCEE